MNTSFWKAGETDNFVEGDVIRIFPGQFEQDVITLRLDDGSLVNIGARREALPWRHLFEELQVKVHGRLCVIKDGEKTGASSSAQRKTNGQNRKIPSK